MTTTAARDLEAFGSRLRTKREALGISQTELARRIGSFQPMISAWERGRELPSRTMLLRLQEALGERVAWLLGVDQPSGELEELVVRVLERLDRKRLDLLLEADPALLSGWFAGLEAHLAEIEKQARGGR